MLPAVALVDPELTFDLPPALTASTGLDALTQLIEPFVSARANAFVDAICRDAIPRVIAALPKAFAGDRAARADMAYASLCGGLALANAGLGAVHGFAGPIGGRFPAPHGAICAVLLPHVVAMNAARTGDPKFAELAAMTGDLAAFVARFALPPLSAYGIGRGRRAGAGRASEAGQLDEGEPDRAVGRRSRRCPDPRLMSPTMTRLRAVLAAACLAASIVSLFAADGPLDRAAAALGVDAIQSLEFEAGGRYYQFGQAPAPELPWPAFDGDRLHGDAGLRPCRGARQVPPRPGPGAGTGAAAHRPDPGSVRGRRLQLEPHAGAGIHPGQPRRAQRGAVDVTAGFREGGARARRGREAGRRTAARP